MGRRKPRSGHGDGLFSWAPKDGVVAVGELLVNPLTVACRHAPCLAPVGQRCTRLGRHGRRRDCAPHPCRRDDAAARADNRPVPVAEAPQDARREPQPMSDPPQASSDPHSASPAQTWRGGRAIEDGAP